jgi:hypothetical protein
MLRFMAEIPFPAGVLCSVAVAMQGESIDIVIALLQNFDPTPNMWA